MAPERGAVDGRWSGLSMVVSHSTDSYGKHRLQLCSFYARMYPELGATVTSATPKGDALRSVAHLPASPTRIIGEPVHDIIALRRLVSTSANDCSNFIWDHTDLITRLSARRAEICQSTRASRCDAVLALIGQQLLRTSVAEPAGVFRTQVAQQPVAAEELRRFLREPHVSKAPVWKSLFGHQPPRGVVARIARRCGAELHPSMAFRNYPSVRAFRAEVNRMRRWYRSGRMMSRARRGIIRSRLAPTRVRGIKSVWSKKVAAHYRRLLKPLRVEGLWNSRDISIALHDAGIPVQTGTVAVERMWTYLKDMLPRGARDMSPRWFRLLSMVAFLRFNYRHFNVGSAPGWTERDSLLAQRIESLAVFAKLLQDAEAGREHLGMIFDPFL